MKFAATIVAFAAAAAAYKKGNVTYTTEVVTEYTTYCPAATTLTYGDNTYTVTEPTTLTITDCPCTISKPVYTSTKVACEGEECYTKPSNATATYKPKPSASATESASGHATAGAGKTVALTGASLAGLLGLAAFAL